MDQDMKNRRKLARVATLGALLFSFSMGVFAAQLKENTADIQQVVNIPGMAIAINPGGSGCNTGRHEVWEPTQNGCSNYEWVKQTARVVSLTATPSTILANNISTSTLLATLKDGDGYLVGPGIPTTWATNTGSLSSYSTVTNASGQTAVTLRGTVAGVGTVTAAAVAGAASANVVLTADPSTSRVVALTPSPASVLANWTPAGLYATVRDAYNNILPAGQPVYWAATLGSLNTGTSYTDGNGVAVATIASGTPGVSTVYARTTVSANAATALTFTPASVPPVIYSFAVYNNGTPNEIAKRDNIIDPNNYFEWSGVGGTRFTITSQDGFLYYDGPGPRYDISGLQLHSVNGSLGRAVFTLTAYNANGETSSASVAPKWIVSRDFNN
jgi:hypothetical protein